MFPTLRTIFLQSILITAILSVFSSCKPEANLGFWSVAMEEISDEKYPDNPEIPLRHPKFGSFDLDSFQLYYDYNNPMARWTMRLKDGENRELQIDIDSIHLFDWIPTVPDHIQKDKVLTRIGLQNQEFNRQQVIFYDESFSSNSTSLEISRIDIARNCLNSYLWEVILFSKDKGLDRVVYHGWFDFHQVLYQDMFEQRNELSFNEYKAYLENWTELEGSDVNLDILREEFSSRRIQVNAQHSVLYPIVGERAKKASNIVAPLNVSSIDDFLNDSTLFATFSAPGLYTKADPQKTKLHLISDPRTAIYREVLVPGYPDKLSEIEIIYDNEDGNATRLIIGGFDLRWVPTLPLSYAHNGFQMPIGIANHSFYEAHVVARQQSSKHNSYYAIMLDSENKFLDSHKIGIDGPLLHFDPAQHNLLHIWLLAFERHAFVGHYVVAL
jgi:hypothetical protein